jgi:hypothetical protein
MAMASVDRSEAAVPVGASLRRMRNSSTSACLRRFQSTTRKPSEELFMKRIGLLALALAALALPGTAVADPISNENEKNAAEHCKNLRSASGSGFAELVEGFQPGDQVNENGNENGRNAYGQCVAFHARDEHNEEARAQRSASRDCRELRESNPSAFGRHEGAQYRNLGQCVSQQRRENKEEMDQQDENQVNAARHCKRERSDQAFFSGNHPDATGQTFAQYYGTNRNDRNAYGKCVSRHAQEMNEQEEQQSS